METKQTKHIGLVVVIAILCALYAAWPIDLIPDVPVIGWIDDIIVAYMGFNKSKALLSSSNSDRAE